MNAEIVTVTNSAFTCIGVQSESGGSNIDYVIMSEVLLGFEHGCKADFAKPWSPHFGIMLTLKIDPDKVKHLVLVRPDLPNKLKLLDANLLEQNKFQEAAKPTHKIEHHKLQELKKRNFS